MARPLETTMTKSDDEAVTDVEQRDHIERSVDSADPAIGADEPNVSGAPAWSRRTRWLAAGLTMLIVIGLALTAYFGHEWHSDRTRADDKQEVLTSARDVAEGLASVSYQTVEADLAAIAKMGNDKFSLQISKNEASQADVIKKVKMVSTAKVVSAGVKSLSSDKAKVDVAVVGSIKSIESPQGTKRSYRMGVSLERDEGQGWQVSNVVFVQ